MVRHTRSPIVSLIATIVLLIASMVGCSDDSAGDGGDRDTGSEDTSVSTDTVDTATDTHEDADALTVSSVQPTSGSVAGGTAVAISGRGFESGAAITFGGNPATDVEVVSSFEIDATTPAGDTPGQVDVTVELSSGESATLSDGFEYVDAQDLEVGWCTIQHPSETTTAPGVDTEPIYGRAYVETCTDGADECGELTGQVGWGAPGDDPNNDPSSYTWVDATYNSGHTSDDNDEFQTTLTVPDEGDYTYAYRFSVDDGESWTYCDLDGTDNGFGQDQRGELTVTTVPVDWCNLQHPETIDEFVGTNVDVYGRVYSSGCTDGATRCSPILGQVGVAPSGSDPTSDVNAYTWSDATYNPGHTSNDNDEYQFGLMAAPIGSSVYTYRFSGDGGQSWTYCDLDGTDNGFQPDQQGTMTARGD